MTYTLGFDVSHWQDNQSTPQRVDFVKAVSEGIKFVFIKAGQGKSTDNDYVYNWENAKTSGLLRGAYHFLVWEVDPKEQARYFWNLIKDDPGELSPVVDFESWKIVPDNADDILWQFISELERLSGKTPMIYTCVGFWNPNGSSKVGWKKYPLWIANYSVSPKIPLPWVTWAFWQFTSKGDGIKYGCESKSVDLNYFNGTEEEFRAFAGVTNNTTKTEPITQSSSRTYKITVGYRYSRKEMFDSSRLVKFYPYGSKVTVIEKIGIWGKIKEGEYIRINSGIRIVAK